MYNNETNDLISIDDLCEMLFIGKNAAYHLLNTGEIKAFRIGRNWKIPRFSVINYIRSKSDL